MNKEDEKYTISVGGIEMEIDKDSLMGRCKEYVDYQNSELLKLVGDIHASYNSSNEGDLK